MSKFKEINILHSSNLTKHNEGYDSQEDLEQLLKITVKISTPSHTYSTQEENTYNIIPLDTGIKQHLECRIKFSKLIDKSSINIIRFLNSVSILLLLLSFFTTSVSQLNMNNYNLLMDYLKRDKIQAEMSLVLALFRNLIILKDIDYSHLDLHTILCLHFKHYYYSGNLLFALCLISNHTKLLEKYGLNCLLCIITIIVYFKVYYSHQNKLSNVKLESLFSFISLSVNISFLLAWNVCYLTISINSFLSLFELEPQTLRCVNLSLQTFLCAFVVLSLSYFYDLFFSFIVLVFQIGNTLNKNIFTSDIKQELNLEKSFANNESNISLGLTCFTTLCFIWSLIYIPRMSNNMCKKNNELSIEDLNKNYLWDKEKSIKL